MELAERLQLDSITAKCKAYIGREFSARRVQLLSDKDSLDKLQLHTRNKIYELLVPLATRRVVLKCGKCFARLHRASGPGWYKCPDVECGSMTHCTFE